MNINPFFGNHCKAIEMVVDTSSNKMYILFRNRDNNINITNVIGRDQIKYFVITVDGSTHSICGAM